MRWTDYVTKLDLDKTLGMIGLMRSQKSSGVGSFFFGMGLGLVAGGAAALLLTPMNGTEAREKLVKAGEEVGRQVTAKVAEIRGSSDTTLGAGTTVSSSSYGTRVGTSY